MNKDLIYIFDKLTFKRQELGEIQSNFNMSLTIDGTKDSTKVMVWSFNESEIEPNTICWHAKTGTWWIVAHDKIERYLNENGTFIYIHNLQLEGAIELLNARDLTDCGFNQNTYTKNEFLNRLFILSSFEFKDDDITIVGPGNFGNQKVDYVKTFENYSLLSAIREFLDSYNMCGKLEFTTRVSGNYTYLDTARLLIINKTGDNTLTAHTMSDFNDVRETKNMDKNSFGTTVVSNAENVISSISKTYPSTGSVRPSATTDNVLAQNAVIRLPSKVYKGNWAKIILPNVPISCDLSAGGTLITLSPSDLNFNAANMENGYISLLTRVKAHLQTWLPSTWEQAYNAFVIELNNQKSYLTDRISKIGTITLYNGNIVTGEYNDQDRTQKGKSVILKGENVPYLAKLDFVSKGLDHLNYAYIFCDKETKNLLPHTYQGLAWERGSNEITGFDAFEAAQGMRGELRLVDTIYTDLQSTNWEWEYSNYGLTVRLYIKYSDGNLANGTFHFRNTTWIFNYIPMSDIKIKVDNSRTKRDMHLYNQNGKLTDNFALSKMLNSYSKEISSDTITKYKWYYSFNDIPKVGSIVNAANNETYVINNVSLDFSQNEKNNTDFGYIIECEITMSKYVSTKSLMVNPNTNIRDYGIPQNFNVKRKQVYRDYYEIGYSLYNDNDTNYYIDPHRMFNIGRTPNKEINLIAVIQCDYEDEINGYSNWYYQLETTTYNMNKMIYVVLDFNDNNIIGYASQNVYSGFVISRVFSGQTDTLNTPISYVDTSGQVKGVDIMFYEIEQLVTIYNEYQEEHSDDPNYQDWIDSGNSLYNYSTFIPQDIYLKARQQQNYALRITESTFVDANSKDYKKDAIEVPVFEYACQVDDSNEVLIGDNILTQHENCIYFYHFIIGDNLTQDNVIDNTHIELPTVQNPYRYRMYDSATITYNDLDTNVKALNIRLYNHTQYNRDTNTWSDYTLNNFEEGRDVAIFRHAYNLVTGEETVELMFIAKKIPSSNISPDMKIALLLLNHYKLN